MDPIDVSSILNIWSAAILISLIMTVIAIVNLYRKPYSSSDQLRWLLIVLFIPIFGSIIYFIFSNPKGQGKTSII